MSRRGRARGRDGCNLRAVSKHPDKLAKADEEIQPPEGLPADWVRRGTDGSYGEWVGPGGSYILKGRNGAEEWHDADGKFHREDGPAVRNRDRVAWYRHGELHRDDGPASETKGSKEWYRNGVLHRDDGPAIVYSNGTQMWYRNGEVHRDDGPAVIEVPVSISRGNGERETIGGGQKWYRKGKLHREDGPAIVRVDGTEEWYQNDVKHREDGPAIKGSDGSEFWYRNGKLHRDDGPAATRADGTQEWWNDGEFHREDGPAVVHPNGTQEWYQYGEHHRVDGPAIVKWDGYREWDINGRPHRDDGPAIIRPDGTQEWWKDGQYHRDDGPAVVTANGAQSWYRHGKFHREDGPAYISPDGYQEWFWNGVTHRDDGPAKIFPDGSVASYVNGEQALPSMRDPATHAATIGALKRLRADPSTQAWAEVLPRLSPKALERTIGVLDAKHFAGVPGLPPALLEQLAPHMLSQVAKFWNGYERKVGPHHFAAIEHHLTGQPVVSMRDHRGNVGSSLTSAHLLPFLGTYAANARKSLERFIKYGDVILSDDGDFELRPKSVRSTPRGLEVRVYRGINGNYAKGILDSAGHDPGKLNEDGEPIGEPTLRQTRVRIPVQHLTSWSLDPQVARRFAVERDLADQADAPLVIRGWLPIKHVLHTGFTDAVPEHKHVHPGEAELVAGHPTKHVVVSTEDLLRPDPDEESDGLVPFALRAPSGDEQVEPQPSDPHEGTLIHDAAPAALKAPVAKAERSLLAKADEEIQPPEGLPADWVYLGTKRAAYGGVAHVWKGPDGSTVRMTANAETWLDGDGEPHREDGPAVTTPEGSSFWFRHGKFHREDGPAAIHSDEKQEWYQDGHLHREDGPAVIHPDGKQEWYWKGQHHRDDGPALILPDGSTAWYRKGLLHRDGGPAVLNQELGELWYQNGQLHREGGPAVTRPDGSKEWVVNGRYHREDGPAVIDANGVQRWYRNDQIHREDGPAIIRSDGTQEWYRNNERHREDGPAIVTPREGEIWYLNGKKHRVGGPAVIGAKGKEEWYRNGELHREDGPAIINSDGSQEWWQNDARHREDGPAIIHPVEGEHWFLDGQFIGGDRPHLIVRGIKKIKDEKGSPQAWESVAGEDSELGEDDIKTLVDHIPTDHFVGIGGTSPETKRAMTPFMHQMVADFWLDYERDVQARHFAAVQHYVTGRPVTDFVDHRGDVGSSLESQHLLPFFGSYANGTRMYLDGIGARGMVTRRVGGKKLVRVYRGVTGDYARAILDAAGHDGEGTLKERILRVPVQHLTSWSLNPHVARRFAGRHIKGQPEEPLVIRRWLPIEHVLHSGFVDVIPDQKHAHEAERELVAGHPAKTISVRTTDLFRPGEDEFVPFKIEPSAPAPTPEDPAAAPAATPPAPVAKAEHRSLEPFRPTRETPSDEGYVYHATNDARAADIAREGLLTHLPHEHTDQECWPDGSIEKRNYHSRNAGSVWAFAPEWGRAVVLRTKLGDHPFRRESGTGDIYSTRKIPASKLEIGLADGSWAPLAEWARSRT